MPDPHTPASPGGGSGGVAESHSQNYESLPTPPPRYRGPRQSFGSDEVLSADRTSHRSRATTTGSSHNSHGHEETPLPKKQLAILAFISLCEQTALNSISPYLPRMVESFPDTSTDEVGMYVGAIASAFALAQFLTNYFWGRLSDEIGRKPVVLIGTFATAIGMVGFGFSTRFWHAVLTQSVIGLLNGNQGVVSTCLGEITDKSNQSKAFTYLPVIYGLGGITGPMLGGFFTNKAFPQYPYLLPNLIAAAILFVDLVASMIFLDESHEHVKSKSKSKPKSTLFGRVSNIFASFWQFMSGSHRPTYLNRRRSKNADETSPLLANGRPQSDAQAEQDDDEEGDDDDDDDDLDQDEEGHVRPWEREVPSGIVPKLKRLGSVVSELLPSKPPQEARDTNTILLLVTFLLFQFANVSFNSVYPIFAEAAEPIGRNLAPEVVGFSLSFAGAATIVFQVGLFNRLKHKLGNKVTWRASLFIFIIAFLMMPFVPYKGPDDRHVRDNFLGSWYGKELLYIFLGVVLLLKTIATNGGLTSALLLITNSASSPAVLGSLNGLAQTLSALGRAVGPFLTGSLFSLAYKVPPKGEFLPFGLFAGVSALGFGLSLFIKGNQLESSDNEESESDDDDNDDVSDDGEEEEGDGQRGS